MASLTVEEYHKLHLTVFCSHCYAKIGEPCTGDKGRRKWVNAVHTHRKANLSLFRKQFPVEYKKLRDIVIKDRGNNG